MEMKIITRWLKVGCLATAACAGCQRAETPRTVYAPARMPANVAAQYAPNGSRWGGSLAASPMPEQAPGVATIVGQSAPTTQTGTEPVKQEVAATPLPEPPEAPTVAATPPLPSELPPMPATPAAEVMQAETSLTAPVATPVAAEMHTLIAPQPTRRRSYVDTTANPCFAHSEDYRTLTGQLQHSRLSKSWRLRFASVDEVDPYGGSVSLLEDSRLADMKDGQFVQVHGHLLNPDEKGIAPPYQIDSIHVVENGQ
jgi:hypothetical protein